MLLAPPLAWAQVSMPAAPDPADPAAAVPSVTYRSAFAYIFAGSGSFRDASKPFGVKVEKEYMGEELNIRDLSGNRTLVVFDTGDEITVQAGEFGPAFLPRQSTLSIPSAGSSLPRAIMPSATGGAALEVEPDSSPLSRMKASRTARTAIPAPANVIAFRPPPGASGVLRT